LWANVSDHVVVSVSAKSIATSTETPLDDILLMKSLWVSPHLGIMRRRAPKVTMVGVGILGRDVGIFGLLRPLMEPYEEIASIDSARQFS
jgi:hypothetical protein